MIFVRKARDQVNNALQNWWVRLFIGLIGFVATYIQYREGGLTQWFWILLLLTILVAILVIATPLIKDWYQEQKRKWIYDTKEEISQNQKIDVLTALINDFETIEKAKKLLTVLSNTENTARALAILPIEQKLGVILNVGKKENLQLGTRLTIFRKDNFTSDGEHIEQPLALVEVSYIQTENNCSQAVVVHQFDEDYWIDIRKQLLAGKKVVPPKNVVMPHILSELSTLSLEDLESFRQYLETIRDSLVTQLLRSRTNKEIVQ